MTQKTLRKNLYVVFSDFYFFVFYLFIISLMNSPRNGELPPWYGQ